MDNFLGSVPVKGFWKSVTVMTKNRRSYFWDTV